MVASSPLTCGASQSGCTASFIKPQVQGHHYSQRGLASQLPAYPPPRGTLSPGFGAFFHVGFPETPSGSCDRGHGSGTWYISKIPSPIFRRLLPCAYPSPNCPFHDELYPPLQWGIRHSEFMNQSSGSWEATLNLKPFC